MCILANTDRQSPSVFINKVTGLSIAGGGKNFINSTFQLFCCPASGLLWRMEECFWSKTEILESIGNFLDTWKL